ncbi:hypothetical protein B0J17DRAFT_683875, partial [Rhizoctonia solani]
MTSIITLENPRMDATFLDSIIFISNKHSLQFPLGFSLFSIIFFVSTRCYLSCAYRFSIFILFISRGLILLFYLDLWSWPL